jgi:hypothetical protein
MHVIVHMNPHPHSPDQPPRDTRRLPAIALLAAMTFALSLGGCKSIGTNPTRIANDVLPNSPIIPDYRVPVAPGLSIPLDALIAGAIVYWFVDPLAPNWEISERRINHNLVHIALRKKRFSTGGDGEAPQIIRRRATELAMQAGVGNYQLIEYSESLDSETIGPRRVTTALVRLTNERIGRMP